VTPRMWRPAMPIYSSLPRVLACLLLLAAAPAAQAAKEGGPGAMAASFDAALLDSMKSARALGPQGRFDRLAPVMQEDFDFTGMTRDIAGLQWGRLGQEQQNRLVAAFSRFEVAMFADWFDSYAGQNFQVKDIVIRNDDIATVGVSLSGAGPVLRLEYVLRADEAGVWRIVDVRYEGWMSVVERRREEFAEILSRYGFEELIARLETKGHELVDHPDNAASSHLQRPIRDLWDRPIMPIQ
jgi:phospholipid transport system substrate-binding protein